jgi:hypothetical protein
MELRKIDFDRSLKGNSRPIPLFPLRSLGERVRALRQSIAIGGRYFGLLLLAFCVSSNCHALPKRLVLLVDGVSYRDMKALQVGVTYLDPKGRRFTRQAFHDGYFPASRLISTFPSASDVAWTEILGNRPLPGYQRTYLCAASGTQIHQNGVTSSMEYERQMHWELESGIRRGLGYVYPHSTFNHEVRELLKAFLQARDGTENFYGLIRASDDAQHTSGDIFALLCFLDDELRQLCERYRVSEGRELEILILSDHGNDRSGPGKRLPIRAFLKNAGYRVTDAIRSEKDIVLPTVGIQSWVELQCAPAATERLAERLPDLEGLDCLTAQVPGQPRQFLILNAKRERARIEWNPDRNSFCYVPESGDPLGYQPVLDALARQHQLDSDGFAPAEAWMRETLTHRYPLAPERIVRGHTQLALNPASILISARNGYVHCSWILKQFSSLVRLGGTHGSLDDRASTGVLLSNFAPTADTSTLRVATLYDGFKGRRDYRALESGAEWIARDLRTLPDDAPGGGDSAQFTFPSPAPLLRIWTPSFAVAPVNAPIDITLTRVRKMLTAPGRRSDPVPADTSKQSFRLNLPLPAPTSSDCERIYELPHTLVLEPQKSYRMSGRSHGQARSPILFAFTFQTDRRGWPVVE